MSIAQRTQNKPIISSMPTARRVTLDVSGKAKSPREPSGMANVNTGDTLPCSRLTRHQCWSIFIAFMAFSELGACTRRATRKLDTRPRVPCQHDETFIGPEATTQVWKCAPHIHYEYEMDKLGGSWIYIGARPHGVETGLGWLGYRYGSASCVELVKKGLCGLSRRFSVFSKL